MKSTQKATANTIVQIAGRFLRIPLRLLVNALLARYLLQEGFGQYSLILVVVLFLNQFVDLGINDIVVREISKKWDTFNENYLNLLVLKTVLSALAVGIGVLAVLALGYSPEVRFATFVASLMLFFNIFISIGSIAIRARLEMKYAVYCDVLAEVVYFLLILVVTRFHASILTIIECWLFSRFVQGASMYAVLIRRYHPRIERLNLGSILSLLRESLVIWFAQIMAVTYSYIDVLMLSKLSGEEAVGLYNASFSLIQQMTFVPLAIMHSVFPLMCSSFQENREGLKVLYQKSMDIMVVLALPMAVVGMIYAGELVRFLYGEAFAPSAQALQVLIWGCALMFVSVVMPFTFIACHQQDKNLYFGITGVVINIGLNIVLIPKYSFMGASIATVVTEFVVLAITIVVLSRLLHYVPNPEVFLKSAGACVALGLVVYLVKPYGDLLALAAGTASYGFLFWRLRVFSKREILLALGRAP